MRLSRRDARVTATLHVRRQPWGLAHACAVACRLLLARFYRRLRTRNILLKSMDAYAVFVVIIHVRMSSAACICALL